MIPAEFDEAVLKVVELRENGHPEEAARRFQELETQAATMNEFRRELSIRGQRLVCYLHMYQNGQGSALSTLLTTSRDAIRLSSKLRGQPEIQTFRYRYAQALFIAGNFKQAWRQINMALEGANPKQPHYFEFLSLRAVIATGYSAQAAAKAEKWKDLAAMLDNASSSSITKAFNAWDEWQKNYNDYKVNRHAERDALIHHTGILLRFLEMCYIYHLANGKVYPGFSPDVISTLKTLTDKLAKKHRSPQRKQQLAALIKKYERKDAKKQTR